MFLVKVESRYGESEDVLFKEEENAKKKFEEFLQEAMEDEFNIERDRDDYFFTAIDDYDEEVFTVELKTIDFKD